MADKQNAREIVLDMLLEVIEQDKYSHTVLNHTLRACQQLERQERAFITRLFNGTIKAYLTLDYVIDQLSTLPVNRMKPLIRNLLRMSAYQILYMDQVPVSAACNEAVKLAKKRGFTKLSGFVNGVLRNLARNRNEIRFPKKNEKPREYLSVEYSCPSWLVGELLGQYSFEETEQMLAASLKEKETTIRCNSNKISPEALKQVLQEEGVTAETSEYLDYAFRIRDYDYLEKHASFLKGYYTVQDVSSMLVCEVADIHPDSYVIDVCAAPGGKALHAAQKALKVSARDITDYKVALINENIKRLGLMNVETRTWDATITDTEAIGAADVVIADLPCSGLGVLGKKPDIKYKLTQQQKHDLVPLQRKILEVVQEYVKEGGVLIYSTCTVNTQENQENREWFLKHFDFRAESLDAHLPKPLQNDTTKEGYLQLLQGIHNTDGFFIAKFRKMKNQ